MTDSLNDCLPCPFCGVAPDYCLNDDTVCCPDGSCICGQNFFSRKQWNARVNIDEYMKGFNKCLFTMSQAISEIAVHESLKKNL